MTDPKSNTFANIPDHTRCCNAAALGDDMSRPMTENISDEQLKALFRSLPEATPSPWFTRRVLNRLPEKRRRVAMRVEYALYALGLVWMLIWGGLLIDGLTSHGFVVGDLLVYGAWLLVSGGLIYALVEPSLYAAAARQEARRQHNEQASLPR